MIGIVAALIAAGLVLLLREAPAPTTDPALSPDAAVSGPTEQTPSAS